MNEIKLEYEKLGYKAIQFAFAKAIYSLKKDIRTNAPITGNASKELFEMDIVLWEELRELMESGNAMEIKIYRKSYDGL